MNNQEIYQKEVNTIFSYLAKLKDSINDNDNINFINNLEEYKPDAITFASLINEQNEVGEERD